MTVNRKIFITIAAFIVSLSVLFVLMTYFVIQQSFEVMVEKTRGEELSSLSGQLIRYYGQSGQSWESIQQLELDDTAWSDRRDVSFVVLSNDRKPVYAAGSAVEKLVTNLGIERTLRLDGRTIGTLYYYDPEVANQSKLRIGIPISVTFLLSASTIVLIFVSLLIAYWIARRITAPLRQLIPAIDRLGEGKFGTQAPVLSNDEYGKVAVAFNGMSHQLQQAEEVRRNLVADVAHELRTPLTIVRGKLDLLQQEGAVIEQERLLPLQDELIRLSRLVDDLHQLSLAEAKKLPLEKKPTNMTDLLRRIVEHIEPDAEDKQIRIVLENNSCDSPIRVDPNRITQVFLNLLINAIRYTPAGGVVTVAMQELAAPGEEHAKLRISVADTGSGIHPEQLPYIFNRFYRTDEARARHSGGMGLGLAIAKQFVLAHDGTISVESRSNQGTVFIVELPF